MTATRQRRARTPVTKLERTAYHEAGHAVMAVLCKVGLLGVSIAPTSKYHGISMLRPSTAVLQLLRTGIYDPSEREAERQILISYAGQCAEIERCVSRDERYSWEDDEASVADVAMSAWGSEDEIARQLDRLRRKAHARIVKRWPSVDRVARALLERTTLSEEDVIDLVPEPMTRCRDCNARRHDLYMVRDRIWKAACPDDKNAGKVRTPGQETFYVCLHCLQARVKRPLVPRDFDLSIPCNADLFASGFREAFQRP